MIYPKLARMSLYAFPISRLSLVISRAGIDRPIYCGVIDAPSVAELIARIEMAGCEFCICPQWPEFGDKLIVFTTASCAILDVIDGKTVTAILHDRCNLDGVRLSEAWAKQWPRLAPPMTPEEFAEEEDDHAAQ
jgi:hypothetical protein